MKSNRITIIQKEKLTVDLEYNEHYFILHLPVCKLTKETFLDMQIIVEELKDFASTIGYEGVWAAVGTNDKVTEKLAHKLGFSKLGEAEGMTVFEYEEKE